jgi:ABC-2 type transport system ATP-binding protein
MSSHILADVERVCNVVGIINKGRMVVESPRETLMERFARPIFEAQASEAEAALRWGEMLRPLPWVVAVSVEGELVRITVRDINAARREIMASAVAQNVTLHRYEEMRPSLEDVFLQLTSAEVVQ